MKRIRIIALVSSVLLMLSLGLYLTNLNNPRSDEAIEYVDVIAAAVEIPANTVVTSDMLKTISVPAEFVNPNSVTEMENVLNKMTRATIYSDEIILANRLVAKGESESAAFGLAYVIEDGKRGVSVALDIPQGVSSLLQVGNYVDVIYSGAVDFHLVVQGRDGEEDVTLNKSFTTILLQDIKVISTDYNITGGVDSTNPNDTVVYESVTLEVNPVDAQKLVYAINNGMVWLALRPQGDHSYVETTDILIDDIVDKARLIEAVKAEYER